MTHAELSVSQTSVASSHASRGGRLRRITEVGAAIACLGSLYRLAATWFTTPPPDPLGLTAFIMLSLLALCILHAGITKGWARALGFSALSAAVSWAVEFVGCNYGWWFGDYEYTSALGWSVGNVPILVVVSCAGFQLEGTT